MTEGQDPDPSNFKSEGNSRRDFLKKIALGGAGFISVPFIEVPPRPVPEKKFHFSTAQNVPISLSVNGQNHSLQIDTRTTLLDLLREKINLPGTKKGCDRGQCGACTVLLNGNRVNSCLLLAASCNHATVTTVEGLENIGGLHPMQSSFIKHDAFQCGYCTPGQICSAVGLIHESHAKTNAEIREQMSGNICRCGAYKNIVEAIQEVRSSL
jgi:xanthine dehydrogenase YagT iron-sulfur-binding subunit